MNATLKPAPDKKSVLAKAVLNSAEQLDINASDLAEILGVHRTSLSRIKTKMEIDPDSKMGELSLLFIRIYRSVYALSGGEPRTMRLFIKSKNKVTGGIPVEQMKTITGLVSVLQFVDAMRGKI